MIEEEEKPISQIIPLSDGMKTLVGKIMVPRWVFKLPAFIVRALIPESDFMKLLCIIFGGMIVAAVWGAWDYSACKVRNPACTFIECTSHNEPAPIKRPRQ